MASKLHQRPSSRDGDRAHKRVKTGRISTSETLTLPPRPADTAKALSNDRVLNVNHGSGTQNNATQIGGHSNSQYNADVQYFHSHEPLRPQAKRPWRLPRQAAGNYAGYKDVLERLAHSFLEPQPGTEQKQTLFVLSGMGGVGKSESVLQFLKNNDSALRKRYWATFWVDCSSEATTRADFKSINPLCGWAPDDADSLHGAKDQLASLDELSLLVLDNCDDPKTNFSRYIPNSPKVSVILTTRLSDANKYASLSTSPDSIKLFLRLTGLDSESAADLILKASEVQERDEQTFRQACHIADALEYHPLAIVVASSLIQSMEYSLEEYVAALANRFTQKELLDTESEQSTYRKVSATFEMSAKALEALATTDSSAQDALTLLDLLAFMHHQDISEDIFTRAWQFEEEVISDHAKDDWPPEFLGPWHVAQSRCFMQSTSAGEKKRAFRKSRAHLVRLSLVSMTPKSQILSLHPLVHAWAKERNQRLTESWKVAASILALSTQNRSSWQAFTDSISKHLHMCFTLGQSVSILDALDLGICQIWHAFTWQLYRASSPGTLEVCGCLLRELYHKDYDKALLTQAQHLLGIVYEKEGRIAQAIEMFEHVVRIRAKLAEGHPDRLASQHELAGAYLRDGRTSQAIEMFEHVVQIQAKLAEDCPNRLASQHQLAGAYLRDGRTSQAIEMFEHVVRIEAKLAEDHPNRLTSQHQLAGAYLQDGRTSQAIEMFEHVVRIRAKLAEDHPDRLASQHELARAYLRDGRTSQAIEMFERVVRIEAKLAEDHPDRLTSQHGLARAYLRDGRTSQAIEMFERVVRIEAKLAEDHPSRLTSQHELARAYWNNNQLANAEELMSQVVAVKQHIMREDHPERIKSQNVLASIRKEAEKWAAAVEIDSSSDSWETDDSHASSTSRDGDGSAKETARD